MKYDAAPVWFGYSGTKLEGKTPKECVLVDLDGTVLNNEHRQHFMQGANKRWGAFFDAMKHDGVYPEVRFLVDLIFMHSKVEVILVTGRPSQYHGMTLESLHNNGVNYSALIMRAQTDNRPDAYVKRDMLAGIVHMGFKPILAIDDRPEVVQMWRQSGVRTLACDPGAWREHVISANLMDKLLLIDENERLKHRIEELEGKGRDYQTAM